MNVAERRHRALGVEAEMECDDADETLREDAGGKLFVTPGFERRDVAHRDLCRRRKLFPAHVAQFPFAAKFFAKLLGGFGSHPVPRKALAYCDLPPVSTEFGPFSSSSRAQAARRGSKEGSSASLRHSLRDAEVRSERAKARGMRG